MLCIVALPQMSDDIRQMWFVFYVCIACALLYNLVCVYDVALVNKQECKVSNQILFFSPWNSFLNPLIVLFLCALMYSCVGFRVQSHQSSSSSSTIPSFLAILWQMESGLLLNLRSTLKFANFWWVKMLSLITLCNRNVSVNFVTWLPWVMSSSSSSKEQSPRLLRAFNQC